MSVSVTALLTFLAVAFGSSRRLMRPFRGGRRLAHLDRRVLKVVDLRRLLQDVRLRDREGLAVAAVEALGEVAGQLDVLALVLADRYLVRLVQEDVGDLEDRVREQADAGAVGALLGGLVLELGHAGRLAEAGQAVHDPGELGVLGDMALDEERAALRVESGGQQLRGGEPGVGAQVRRVLRDRDRVQVDDHVERVVGLLQGHPLAHGAEVVAEVERACCGLDSGEHAGSVRGHVHHSLRCWGPVRNWSETGGNRWGPGGVTRV